MVVNIGCKKRDVLLLPTKVSLLATRISVEEGNAPHPRTDL